MVATDKSLARTIGTWLITVLFFVSALMVVVLSAQGNNIMTRSSQLVVAATQNHLRTAAIAASGLVNWQVLDQYHTEEDTQNQEYEDIKELLIKFGEEHEVLFVYFWRDYGDGQGQFIIDNDTDPETTVGPKDLFEIEEIALEALSGSVSVTDLEAYTPGWDGLLTASAPVYDDEGNIYCIAGVDASDAVILAQKNASGDLVFLQLFVISVSIVFGVFNMALYQRKARQSEAAREKLQYFNNNLRRAFSTYLSGDVVEEIVSDPSRLHLGGIKRRMTALFTDVKDFSRIAERLPPEELVDLLNDYLSTMSDVILENKGTIDKYEGDAIVSFFGAPIELKDHAFRACVSAIIMKRLETELNKKLLQEKRTSAPLLTRIGINTGDMVVGNMGTERKMNYTIMSNAVNLAARLEGVNKQYGTWILTSEDTIQEAGDQIIARRLDKVRVVGIQKPVRLYEVLEIACRADSSLRGWVAAFHNALDLFEARKWEEAAAGFNRVLLIVPNDIPSQVFIKRCEEFMAAPPDETWEGIFTFNEK
jgi:class 3 adenylate cyclase